MRSYMLLPGVSLHLSGNHSGMYAVTMEEALGDYKGFIENIDAGLKRLGIDAASELVMMDHVCYRVESDQEYAAMLSRFGKIALLLDESEVSGRQIATFALNKPLSVGRWTVPYLELPQPKPGSPYLSGLEHAELVTLGSLADFAGRHTELPLDDKAMGKLINPELVLKTADISVKFHELSLGAVVRLEQRLRAAGLQY